MRSIASFHYVFRDNRRAKTHPAEFDWVTLAVPSSAVKNVLGVWPEKLRHTALGIGCLKLRESDRPNFWRGFMHSVIRMSGVTARPFLTCTHFVYAQTSKPRANHFAGLTYIGTWYRTVRKGVLHFWADVHTIRSFNSLSGLGTKRRDRFKLKTLRPSYYHHWRPDGGPSGYAFHLHHCDEFHRLIRSVLHECASTLTCQVKEFYRWKSSSTKLSFRSYTPQIRKQILNTFGRTTLREYIINASPKKRKWESPNAITVGFYPCCKS